MKKIIFALTALIFTSIINAQEVPAPLFNTDSLDLINMKFYDYFYEIDKTTNIANLSTEKKFEFIDKAFSDYGYSYKATLESYIAKIEENPDAVGSMDYAWGIIVVPFEGLDNTTIIEKFKPEISKLMIKIKELKKN
jgi:hypothetical protein